MKEPKVRVVQGKLFLDVPYGRVELGHPWVAVQIASEIIRTSLRLLAKESKDTTTADDS